MSVGNGTNFGSEHGGYSIFSKKFPNLAVRNSDYLLWIEDKGSK